jgi:hypothetical protein
MRYSRMKSTNEKKNNRCFDCMTFVSCVERTLTYADQSMNEQERETKC